MVYPLRPFTYGSHGLEIVHIQNRLNKLAVAPKRLMPDGMFGPKTAEHVRLFQQQRSAATGVALPTDGAVDSQTYEALFGPEPGEPAVSDPLLAAAIRIARSQIGVSEQPPGSNRGPEVDRYVKAAGLDPAGGHAWCAAFLCWVFCEASAASARPSSLPRTAGVRAMWQAIGERGLLRIAPPDARADPERIVPGMLFFLGFGRGLGHTGLIVARNGERLTTIEGNTSQKSGSREGTGVFERDQRRIADISLGFADVTRRAA